MGLFGRVVGLTLTVALVGCDEFSADPGGADARADATLADGGSGVDAAAPDAGARPTFLGYRSAAAPKNTSLTAELPAGAAAGDVAVAVWVAAFAVNTPPTGWEVPVPQAQFGVVPTDDAVLWLGSKVVADPSEKTVFAMNAAGKQSVTILLFRGARTTQPLVNPALAVTPGSGGKVSAPGFVTQASSTAAVYVFASVGMGTFAETPPSGVAAVVSGTEFAIYRLDRLLQPGESAPPVSIVANPAQPATVAVASFGVAAAP
ncbi:MAG: hypothetical protein HOO96_23290 [Polyangiaceae bacterium]|nr:hypothetical protein [Polyangiaceae bacterium]